MDLEKLKYSELQKLAKNARIKANQKLEKLVQALQDYYSKREPIDTSMKSQHHEDESQTFEDRVDSSEEELQHDCEINPEAPVTPKAQPELNSRKNRRGTFTPTDVKKTLQASGTPEPGIKPGGQRKRNSTFERDGTQATEQSVEAQATPDTKPESAVKPGARRKRYNTFKLDRPSLGAPATPEIDQPASEATNITDQKQASPGVQTMLDSMSGDISSAERKKRLMEAIDKKVEGKLRTSPRTAVTSGTQIPRFAAFLAQRNKEAQKPVTPGNKDWVKVHKKEFSKFDSVEVYLEKKRKRAEDLTASVKKARSVLHEVQEAVTKLKNKRTPSLGKKQTGAQQPFKPTVTCTKNINFNFAANTQRPKTPSASDRKSQSAMKPFKPTVISTKDMNLKFSAMHTPSARSTSMVLTTDSSSELPQRPSGNQASRKSAGRNGNLSVRKSLGASTRKSTTTTPFRFTGALNTSQVNKSTAKLTFDLKASLARPITWKPHIGKLKPVDHSLYGGVAAATGSVVKKSGSRHLEMYKTQHTQARTGRRAAAAAHRAEKKGQMQMERRGITGVH